MTSPTPQAERRRAARAAAAFPVHLAADAADTPKAEQALLRDLSEIGLACDAPEPIEEMTLVGINFALPGQVEKHHVKGAVVRCEPFKSSQFAGQRWDIAVYFTEVTPVTKAALANYVKHH